LSEFHDHEVDIPKTPDVPKDPDPDIPETPPDIPETPGVLRTPDVIEPSAPQVKGPAQPPLLCPEQVLCQPVCDGPSDEEVWEGEVHARGICDDDDPFESPCSKRRRLLDLDENDSSQNYLIVEFKMDELLSKVLEGVDDKEELPSKRKSDNDKSAPKKKVKKHVVETVDEDEKDDDEPKTDTEKPAERSWQWTPNQSGHQRCGGGQGGGDLLLVEEPFQLQQQRLRWGWLPLQLRWWRWGLPVLWKQMMWWRMWRWRTCRCWKKKNDVAKMRQAGTAPATGATIYCLSSLWCTVPCKRL